MPPLEYPTLTPLRIEHEYARMVYDARDGAKIALFCFGDFEWTVRIPAERAS